MLDFTFIIALGRRSSSFPKLRLPSFQTLAERSFHLQDDAFVQCQVAHNQTYYLNAV